MPIEQSTYIFSHQDHHLPRSSALFWANWKGLPVPEFPIIPHSTLDLSVLRMSQTLKIQQVDGHNSTLSLWLCGEALALKTNVFGDSYIYQSYRPSFYNFTVPANGHVHYIFNVNSHSHFSFD
ncbi:hypothetical protein GEMRC1_005682 [Eukaryota sp. GEM-RC1]